MSALRKLRALQASCLESERTNESKDGLQEHLDQRNTKEGNHLEADNARAAGNNIADAAEQELANEDPSIELTLSTGEREDDQINVLRRSKKKKGKKGSGKMREQQNQRLTGSHQNVEDDNQDESEISQNPVKAVVSPSDRQAVESKCSYDLFVCKASKFIASKELRKRFGADAFERKYGNIESDANNDEWAGIRGSGRSGDRRARLPSRSTIIVEPQDDWPPAPPGLFRITVEADASSTLARIKSPKPEVSVSAQSIRDIVSSRADAEVAPYLPTEWECNTCQLVTIRPSNTYSSLDSRYLAAVNSFDHQEIADFVYGEPHHIDGLLQLSHLAESAGEFVSAHELVQRAVWLCEMALPRSLHLISGSVRFLLTDSLDSVSSRICFAFIKALARHAQMLSKRACPRTSLEVAKIALSLSAADPSSLLLVTDYYAFRAGQHHYVLSFLSNFFYPKYGRKGPSMRDVLETQYEPLIAKRQDSKINPTTGVGSNVVTIDNYRSSPSSSISTDSTRRDRETIALPAFLLPNWSFTAALSQFKLEQEAQELTISLPDAAPKVTNSKSSVLSPEPGKINDSHEAENCAVTVGLGRAYRPSYVPSPGRASLLHAAAAAAAAAAVGQPVVSGSSSFSSEALSSSSQSSVSSFYTGLPIRSESLLPTRLAVSTVSASAAQLLQRALAIFPEALRALLEKAGDKLAQKKEWSELLSHFESWFKPNRVISRLVSIYAQRSGVLWKPASHLALLLESAQLVLRKLTQGDWRVADLERVRMRFFISLPSDVAALQKTEYTDSVPSIPQELAMQRERQREMAAFDDQNEQGNGRLASVQPSSASEIETPLSELFVRSTRAYLESMLPWYVPSEAASIPPAAGTAATAARMATESGAGPGVGTGGAVSSATLPPRDGSEGSHPNADVRDARDSSSDSSENDDV